MMQFVKGLIITFIAVVWILALLIYWFVAWLINCALKTPEFIKHQRAITQIKYMNRKLEEGKLFRVTIPRTQCRVAHGWLLEQGFSVRFLNQRIPKSYCKIVVVTNLFTHTTDYVFCNKSHAVMFKLMFA